MKRQPKPFVVEIKRSSRKTPGLPAPPIWDVAALLSSAESDAHSKPSQAAASALFRTADSAGSHASAPPERRILPVLAMEAETVGAEAPMAVPDLDDDDVITSEIAVPVLPPIEPEIEYLEFDTIDPSAMPEKWPVSTPRLPVPPPQASHPQVENILAFTPEADPDLAIRRSRPDRERDLPRGERWKRRLPKFMR